MMKLVKQNYFTCGILLFAVHEIQLYMKYGHMVLCLPVLCDNIILHIYDSHVPYRDVYIHIYY